jgi:hypothetical protein
MEDDDILDYGRNFGMQSYGKEKQVANSVTEAGNYGDVKLENLPYVQNAEDRFRRKPYNKDESTIMSLFYKNKPDTSDAEAQLRLKRVAQLQAFGNLFKNLGEFVGGRGYAPVSKEGENARLYQTLAQSEAERQRMKELEERYRNQELSLLMRDTEKHDAREDARLARLQAVMNRNNEVDAANAQARNELAMRLGIKHRSEATNNAESTRYGTQTPKLTGSSGSGGYNEKDGSFTYQTADNRIYRIPKNKIETIASEMARLGIISNEKRLEIIKMISNDNISGLKNFVYVYMPEFEKMAGKRIGVLPSPAKQRWADVLDNPYYGFRVNANGGATNGNAGTDSASGAGTQGQAASEQRINLY